MYYGTSGSSTHPDTEGLSLRTQYPQLKFSVGPGLIYFLHRVPGERMLHWARGCNINIPTEAEEDICHSPAQTKQKHEPGFGPAKSEHHHHLVRASAQIGFPRLHA